MPSSTEVGNFQDLIAQVASVAVLRTTGLLSSLSDRDAIVEAYPELIDPFIAAAGQLSAEWYSSLAPTAPFAVEVAPPPPRNSLIANANWALTQFDPAGALSGAAERQVFTTSRDTVVSNASRERVRYARYASANACTWCRVLATREAVYFTAESAVKGHDNCHCIAVPERAGNAYVPPDYVNRWRDDYNAARDEVGGQLDAIANRMRRDKYSGDKDSLNAERRKRYAAKKQANQ